MDYDETKVIQNVSAEELEDILKHEYRYNDLSPAFIIQAVTGTFTIVLAPE